LDFSQFVMVGAVLLMSNYSTRATRAGFAKLIASAFLAILLVAPMSLAAAPRDGDGFTADGTSWFSHDLQWLEQIVQQLEQQIQQIEQRIQQLQSGGRSSS